MQEGKRMEIDFVKNIFIVISARIIWLEMEPDNIKEELFLRGPLSF